MTMSNSSWSALDLDSVGAGGEAGGAKLNALRAGEGYLAFLRFQAIYAMLVAAADAEGVAVDAADRRVVDVFASVSREVAAALCVAASTADRQVSLAVEAVERLSKVARLMRDGVISVAAFGAVVLEATGVEDAELIAAVDAATASELAELGGVSRGDAEGVSRRMVAEIDPDGLRERRTARGKGVTVSHDVDGSDVTIATTPEDAAMIDASVRAVAGRVCENDSRSCGVRRHDAAVALLTGRPFVCDCGEPGCPVTASDDEIAAEFAKIVVHVVADAATVDGDADKAGWLDGFGVIDPHHVREIAARTDARLRPLDIAGLADGAAQAGNPYRPTATCDVAMRAVFGTCSEPGCDRSAWRCDLDHVTEYNHDAPAAGGATCPCNLNPKCRYHHLVKTFAGGWIDDQIIDANGVIWTEVTTPTGYTVRSRARNHWLLPDLGLVPCRHGEPVAPGVVDDVGQPTRGRSRTKAKHAYRMRIRSRRRYIAACAAAAKSAELDSAGPPPF
ncbi:HNH endonuclease [Gordonia sp. HY285]|uniref:HNH endonuclease signature motif containing protein n=1 Tax=Gordonia liuliyuniae TaxID=2911517 RepID=UPI001F2799BD|nr:HNH endonuclease signature motif containing protein [Gordonia liuliyuniae]MCF8608578.1 HNH endonuclease [Gordonia liuliyuniae]